MEPTTITLITFAAVVLAILSIGSLASEYFLREKAMIQERLGDEFRDGQNNRGKKSNLFKNLKLLQSETTQPAPGLWQRFQMLVEQSGLDVSPNKVLAISANLGIVSGLTAVALTGLWPLAVVTAVCGVAAPVIFVWAKRKGRIQKLCMQLPEAFALMSRAVRAGQTMSGAMQLVATQLKSPIRDEFALCCEQQNMGLPQEATLQDLARRMGVIEVRMFVVAMLVQRQAGGNPVEILNNLASMIRKRVRLHAKVKALTSEGRLQAIVLSVLPLVALAALLVLNRSYAQVLLDRPRLLGGILFFEVLGTLWIRRIVNIDP